MVDTSYVRWTGGLANVMWRAVERIVALIVLGVLALVTFGSQPAAAQRNEGSGGFSGLLWEDLDRDGERGSSEESLAGLIVVLHAIDPPGDDEVDRAVTGLDGRFTFENLPDARYEVRVEISSGVSAGTVSGAGVEGRWLSELTTEDWDLGLIRHDPSLPPRSDPVPPPQVSVEAISVERPAASAPTSESVPTDDNPLEVLGRIELNDDAGSAGSDDLTPSTSVTTADSALLGEEAEPGRAESSRNESVAPPPRIDEPAPTVALPAPAAEPEVEVASATTFVEPPVAADTSDTADTSDRSDTTIGSFIIPPAAGAQPTAPSDVAARTDSPSLESSPTTRSSTDEIEGEMALGADDLDTTTPAFLDDRSMMFVTSAALAMTGLALLTGTRRRRTELS